MAIILAENMNALNPTATQSFGIATKRFLENAENEGNSVKAHLAGRALLLGTALFGTAEAISRFVLYCFGQIAALFTFYQSEPVNAFVQNQVKAGFAATIITSASFFSLLSPSVFTTLQFSEEVLPVRQHERIDPPAEEVPPVRQYQRIDEMAVERRREAEMIVDVVKLPFQLMALAFQVPFYCVYLSFQLMLLPIRIALLPLQLMLCPFNFLVPRNNLRLNLI